jgi:predicted pyridoxine 5'-phosphate oxidase superfamily flavin-nucleotide-binding protein
VPRDRARRDRRALVGQAEQVADVVRERRRRHGDRRGNEGYVATTASVTTPAMLTSDMKRLVLEQKLGFAATVCPDGTPNLSPKGTTTVWDDDHLIFADIHSPGTVRNLELNPWIEINVVDPFVRKGYRFKGVATVHADDDVYAKALSLLTERGYQAAPDRIAHIVLVEVRQASQLVSPAYDSGAGEDEVRARWVRHFDALNSGALGSGPP